MILLTGHGSLAEEFKRHYECHIVGIRNIAQVELELQIRKANVIIHNSANLDPKNIEQATNDNFQLSKNLIDTVIRINPDILFIYLSSMSILKDEHSYLDVDVMTTYAFSKYMGEIYCLKSPLINKKIVRFSTIFYANPAKDGLSKLISDAVCKKEIQIFNEGCAKRDFIPLEVAAKYLHKISTIKSNRLIFNVASGKSTSFLELVSIIKSYIPDLTVINKNIESMPGVLHKFSVEPLNELGVVDFELSRYVIFFLNSISGENSSLR
jgi:nucleoside-diphosphate-sugar epimerase